MLENTYPDFKGKTLSIQIVDDDINYDMSDPIFELQGNKLFIKGIVPPDSTGSNWTKGTEIAVAWDRVVKYNVFNSVKEFRIAVKKSDDHEEENKFTNDF